MRTRKVAWRLPPETFELLRPHITIRLRKKRMRKKARVRPELYVNAEGHMELAYYWIREHTRRQLREESFAARVVGNIRNELFNRGILHGQSETTTGAIQTQD